MPVTRASRAGTPGTPSRMPSVSPAFSFVARNLPASTPPLKLFVATTDVLPFHEGMSLSISTILTPAFRALLRAGTTAALVGVIAMPFTPCATMFWIAAISPASSVPLLPWPKITVAPGVAASHFFAAFSSVKKKSTGNLVMKPSFTGVAVLLGRLRHCRRGEHRGRGEDGREDRAREQPVLPHRASFRQANRIGTGTLSPH